MENDAACDIAQSLMKQAKLVDNEKQIMQNWNWKSHEFAGSKFSFLYLIAKEKEKWHRTWKNFPRRHHRVEQTKQKSVRHWKERHQFAINFIFKHTKRQGNWIQFVCLPLRSLYFLYFIHFPLTKNFLLVLVPFIVLRNYIRSSFPSARLLCKSIFHVLRNFRV